MNTIVPIFRDDERLEAASRWVLKIDEGAMNASDKLAFSAWLDENPKNHDVLLEVASVWDKTDALARLADIFPREATADLALPAPWYRPFASGVAVAASLVVLVVAVVLLWPRFETGPDNDRLVPTQTAMYETSIGEKETVLLPDGSEVVLNTNSQLTLSFSPTARVLHLIRGEILIRVASDPARPLSVIAVDRIVQAIGTEFTVEITENQQVEVMVTEGKVVVGIQPQTVGMPGAINGGGNTPDLPPKLVQREENTVSAGEEVILSKDDTVKTAVKTVVTADDIEVKLSWNEGRLIFRSEPLEKALQEVERYTTVEFVLLDESLKSRTVSGRFRSGDVEALLVSLRLNFNITHEFDSEDRVLLNSQ
jgi:transmembrane sensor